MSLQNYKYCFPEKFVPYLSLEGSVVIISWVNVGFKSFHTGSNMNQGLETQAGVATSWGHCVAGVQSVFGECVGNEAAKADQDQIEKGFVSSGLNPISWRWLGATEGFEGMKWLYQLCQSRRITVWRGGKGDEYRVSQTWEVPRFATLVLLLHKSHEIFIYEERLGWGETGGKGTFRLVQ